MNSEKPFKRYIAIVVFVLLFMLAIILKLVSLQVVEGASYKEQSERRLVRPMTVKAPRGEIFDRYGRPLITNRMGFFIQFQKIDISKKELNQVILRLVDMLEEDSATYLESFPVKGPPFEFDFGGADEEEKKEKALSWKQENDFNKDKTAEEIVAYYCERYDVDPEISLEDALRVIEVRYEMEARQFSIMAPYTFAEDIKMDLVQKIKEQYMDLPGVSVEIEPIREYMVPGVASHILGRVGVIYKEEYEELKNQNYAMNDIIGKDGMEKALEKDLKGINGMSNVEQSLGGKQYNVIESKPAVPGNYALLTIDIKLQETAEKALVKTIKKIRDNSHREGGKGSDSYCGAAVAVDVNSGEILAMASVPTYDLTRFNEDYKELSEDPLKPMFNRAINGAYEPGSTFKMVPAISALEEGIIKPNTLITDKGRYTFYKDYQPTCMAWRSGGHGAINVIKALEVSCNYFFYDIGRNTTIEKMNMYSRKLGLGEPTGIELAESTGILASPEYKKKMGQTWYPGDTLQAAIGQSDNMFTPLQLANYMASIANGGKRYRAHLLKETRSYDTNGIVRENKPEILAELNMKNENYKAVMNGLAKVTENGTASSTFAQFNIKVGGKTGTAQAIGTDNGIFVGFAPYDNPQIAVAVVVEHGVHGNSVADVAREIFQAYLGGEEVKDEIPKYNQLLQ